jgi:hypothetical protein
MTDESNNNGEYKYRKTDWRTYVEYRLDELKGLNKDLKGDMGEVLKRLNEVVVAGIVTPAILDQKLREQKEGCTSQFKKVGNPNNDDSKNGWTSIAKWGLKQYGVVAVLLFVVVVQGLLLLKTTGILP